MTRAGFLKGGTLELWMGAEPKGPGGCEARGLRGGR